MRRSRVRLLSPAPVFKSQSVSWLGFLICAGSVTIARLAFVELFLSLVRDKSLTSRDCLALFLDLYLTAKPLRCPWRQFPDVVLHSPESMVKQNCAYALAKSGNLDAAYDLVEETLLGTALRQIQSIIGDKCPYLVSAHALERSGLTSSPS